MFMFVIAIILISLVGLFMQIVNALALFLSTQQLGLGQQLVLWQSLATDYACQSSTSYTDTLVTTTLNTADPVASGIHNMRAQYQGRYWPTAIFTGTVADAPNHRVVLSYIPNIDSFTGIGHGQVLRQFRASFKNNDYRYSATYNGAAGLSMDIIVSDAGGSVVPITISGIPSSVPVGVSGIITSIDCPH